MSEKAEAIRARALREWANRIREAGAEYERTMEALAKEAGIKPKDVPRGEPEKIALRVASSVASAVWEGSSKERFEVAEGSLGFLLRLEAAFEPASAADAQRAALRIVREYAESFDPQLVPGDLHPAYPAAAGIRVADTALLLAYALTAVRPGFATLIYKTAEVTEILKSVNFAPGRHKNGSAKKRPVKELLVLLNALTGGNPLGLAKSTKALNAVGTKGTTKSRLDAEDVIKQAAKTLEEGKRRAGIAEAEASFERKRRAFAIRDERIKQEKLNLEKDRG